SSSNLSNVGDSGENRARQVAMASAVLSHELNSVVRTLGAEAALTSITFALAPKFVTLSVEAFISSA
ncbi:MAG: hypothetical protein ABGY24_08800, partial [bacterium]